MPQSTSEKVTATYHVGRLRYGSRSRAQSDWTRVFFCWSGKGDPGETGTRKKESGGLNRHTRSA